MTGTVVVAVLPGTAAPEEDFHGGDPAAPGAALAERVAATIGWSAPHLVPELEPRWAERPDVTALVAQAGLHPAPPAGTGPLPQPRPPLEDDASVVVSPWNAVLLPMWLSVSPPPAVLLRWTAPERSAAALARSSGIGPALALATWEHWARSALRALEGARVVVSEARPGSAAGASPLLAPAHTALAEALRSLDGRHGHFPYVELPEPSVWGGELLAAHRAAARHAADATVAWRRCAEVTDDAEACARALEWASRSLADALYTEEA